jgi:hypothetical protein
MKSMIIIDPPTVGLDDVIILDKLDPSIFLQEPAKIPDVSWPAVGVNPRADALGMDQIEGVAFVLEPLISKDAVVEVQVFQLEVFRDVVEVFGIQIDGDDLHLVSDSPATPNHRIRQLQIQNRPLASAPTTIQST